MSELKELIDEKRKELNVDIIRLQLDPKIYELCKNSSDFEVYDDYLIHKKHPDVKFYLMGSNKGMEE